MSILSTRRRMLASTAIVSFAAIAMASAAEAQTAPAAQEVVVTGSRIARKDYTADSPIVTVAPAAIENTGAVSLDRLINEVPQFVPGLGSGNNNPGNGQVNIQLRGLGSTRNLVLVDGRRTTPSNVDGTVDINTIPQALIDSIEVVTGGQSTSYGSDAIAGVVNFKLKHHFTGVQIDTTYGISDQDDGQETGVNVTLGSNFADDRGNAVMSLGYSNRDSVFFGQRANVTVVNPTSISSANSDPRILAVSGLSGSKPQGAVSFFGSNLPTQAAVTALFTGYGYNNAAGATQVKNTYSFGINTGGSLFNGPADYKGPTSIDFSTIPGAGVQSNGGFYNTGALNYIQTPLTRYNSYTAVEYDITPHIKAYGQFTFTDSQSATELAPSPASGNPATGGTGFLVAATNPFISADLRSLLNSRPDANAPFLFAKRFSDVGPRHSSFENITYQSLVGFKGDVPGHDLTYDIYAAYGRLDNTTNQSGNISHANMAAVLVNPTTAGGGACSSYNPFGLNGLSAGCAAFISPSTKNQTTYTQRIVEADFQGHLFNLPSFNNVTGGEVRFAAGVDYRDDQAKFQPDALLASLDTSINSYTAGGTTYNLANNTSGVVGFNGGFPVNGNIDVYELYGELLVPVLKNLPFIESLNLDLGGRYSDYSTIGNAYTYKADIDWKMTDWLRFRGGYSRAIRAPNVSELYTPAANGFFDIGAPAAGNLNGDPCDVRGAARINGGGTVDPAKVRALCLAQGVPAAIVDSFQGANTQVQELSGGNPHLQAERANTYTAGFVIQPHLGISLIDRMQLSIDWYSIEINGYITTIPASAQLSGCYNKSGANPTYSATNSFCTQFNRDPATGQIVSGTQQLANAAVLRTSGIDTQLDWRIRFSDIPLMHLSDSLGALRVNATASWLGDLRYRNFAGAQTVQYRGTIGSQDISGASVGDAYATWKGLLNATYTYGPVDIGLVERYVGPMKDATGIVRAPDGTANHTLRTARGAEATFYSDFNLRWRLNDTFEIRGGITNAFNQDPRFYTSASASQGQTDASTYDLIGRRYFVALKARF